ncbi:HDOD domain-containing protein [Geobacter sp. DSM 9736]|uniref:HDOD domain-containing protein n=1 Tax=Geobacter sp. DSM 9736 TaxID=1277350 RepID=UPI000B50DF34|nr:HDOD domain-containing protein [Geobacter sp. DSM 9736]SNB47629.1 HD-like signal output (HDOD) domain, no enzymatic activity [Geobacter sp. DSM 9736]
MEKAHKLQKASQLIAGTTDLPTIPIIATKVLELLEKPDVELDEVADLILTDQVMAARVIKIVNSPLYRTAQEISSVKRALVFLGFRHIRELALTCSFLEAFQGKDGVFDIRTFWEHSFGVGVVSKLIAQRARYHDVEKAYLAGITHDIGEVFFSYNMQHDFQKVLDEIKGRPHKLVETEERYFGTTHCEVGELIAQSWNFPPQYQEVIAHHHAPENATLEPTLVAIVNLADLFCSVRQLGYEGSEWVSFNLAEEGAWGILKNFAPHMRNLDVERFCYELDDKVSDIRELVKSVFEGMEV